MPRKFVLLILLALFLGVFGAVTQAQDKPTVQIPQEPIPVEGLPQQRIDSVFERSADTIRPQGLLTPFALTAEEPSDNCEDAPLLIVNPEVNDGGAGNVRDATEAGTDPVLSCMWGNPVRNKGFRTVWYELGALPYNRVTIDTFNSGYDTVLAVYRGTCDNLVPVHCNDDTNGFTSQLTMSVEKLPEVAEGVEQERYYVEVADWQAGVAPDPTMQLSVFMQPIDSRWETVVAKPANPAISRHAVVSRGQYVYVIGGQTGGEGVPVNSNRVLRLDTAAEGDKKWVDMAPLPGVAGYSNTTAARLTNRIFVPTGYNGNDLGYDGSHWLYNIDGNNWRRVGTTPRFEGEYFAWAAAVVPPSENRYYLTGGTSSTEVIDANANVSDQVFFYDPPSNGWTALKPMQASRYAHAAGWIETNNLGICVAGGLSTGVDSENNGIVILHPSVECYQPGGDWQYIGNMRIPRYGAGSAVGPDGKWYIFGGNDENHNPVPQTEVYDPVSGTWTILDPAYDLGTFRTMPARFWPRGALVGNDLWVIGGSIIEEGEEAVPALDQLFIPSHRSRIPILMGNYNDADRPDDSFPTARPMGFGGVQVRNFDQQRDFFDFYSFSFTGTPLVTIDLEVPDNNNFDLELYGENKLLWGSSKNPRQGEDEQISLILQPRRYFIKVIRAFPTEQPDKGAYYTLRLNR